MSLDDAWQASGLVGKRLGRYLIASARAAEHRELYDAEDVDSGGRVTLLVVRTGELAATRRAEKLKAIQHPNLVDVLDVGKLESGELYVAMEQPSGKPLRDLAGGAPLAQRRALLIVRQVLEALEAAHAAGEIHGNVHPGAIFVVPGLADDRVKLGELGIAALTGAKHAADPVYAASEIARGLVDLRADLYAAGAVLYELLTGRPPFAGDDREALHRLHAYAPVQKLAQRVADATFSDELETIVATALAKTRDRRFRTARAMIEAIDRALPAVETAPDPVPPAPAPAPDEAPDESLLLIMQDLKERDLKKQQAPEPILDVAMFPDNVGREVPVPPWPERARETLGRWLERTSTRLRISRRTLSASLAGICVLGLVLGVVVCRGSGDPAKARAPIETAQERPDAAALDPEATPDPDAAPEATPADLDARCEQLGKACGDTPKRKSTVIDQCKQATASHASCIDATLGLYDCYEAHVCGKTDKVWAFADLGVLAGRHAKCATEIAAQRACMQR